MQNYSYTVKCDKKHFGKVYITRQPENWKQRKVATLIYGDQQLFGGAGLFELSEPDKDIIEILVKRINPNYTSISITR